MHLLHIEGFILNWIYFKNKISTEKQSKKLTVNTLHLSIKLISEVAFNKNEILSYNENIRYKMLSEIDTKITVISNKIRLIFNKFCKIVKIKNVSIKNIVDKISSFQFGHIFKI